MRTALFPSVKSIIMKRISCWTLLIPTFFVPIALAQSVPPQQELLRRAETIKPAAEELKWQRIPWLTDLTRAVEVAQIERRPIFLWVTGDDPLERC